MEAAAVSIGKAALNGLLRGAKSAIAEESALTQAVERDMVFLADELAEMQTNLRDVAQQQDYSKVPRSRVKQLRSLAYDVEDCLQEYSVHLEKPSGWRRPRAVLERHRIAAEMKGLRARVEDMNKRNMHHQLIHNPGSTIEQSGQSISAAPTFGIHKEGKSRVDLEQLIDEGDRELRVIAVWGTSGCLGQMHIIRTAYERPHIKRKFSCRAWVKMMQPLNPKNFVQSLVKQFHSTTGVESMVELDRDKPWRDLIEEFNGYVHDKSYLIVINGLCAIEEWDEIKTCFPNNMKGSRIILCTSQVEVASLCAGQTSVFSDLRQLSPGPTVYAFYEKKDSQGGTNSMKEGSSYTMDIINTRMEITLNSFKESQLIGRWKEKTEIINLISSCESQEFEVISICGMGGLGKTTLVKHLHQSQEVIVTFEKRACVTIKRPFNPIELIDNLVAQLGDKQEHDGDPLADLLRGKRYLIILDDISSTMEWDAIVQYFPRTVTTSRIIITTRDENICKHCSKKERNIYKLSLLGDKDAENLFTEKVFGMVKNLDEQYPELTNEAKLILKRCNGLPLAIVTVGGFLMNRPKTLMEWRKFNDNFSDELEINMEVLRMPNVLIEIYEGLPYHLKYCFLYLAIFPEDYNISRRRLVQRWTAEGYSNEVHGKSLEEIADGYFMELIDRSVILPVRKSIPSGKGIMSCQLHDLMREICISKAMDENLFVRLEAGSSSTNNTRAKIRHVAISSNWDGDKGEFESAVDWTRMRSLTVFGNWRPFFISEKMRMLRVLDLAGTSGLLDHHLGHIGRLLHLKYISLRGCSDIYHLPDSWGNLRRLEALDMKGTYICKLPKSIIELTNLQYLFAGDFSPFCVNPDERLPGDLAQLCGACCAPKLLKDVERLKGDPNWHDVCTFWCHVVFPTLASRRLYPYGVVVPRGIRKLKALRTLGVVNIRGSGKAILRDIRRLTQLRKLAVTGVNWKNYEELCFTLSELSLLESLSVESPIVSDLHGCLDGVSSPPKNLQSLKLDVTLVKLPEWIGGLQSLVKLVLAWTKLTEIDATMQVLGKLPNLAILRLMRSSFNVEKLCLTFHQEAFPSLMLLHLSSIHSLGWVEFEEGAMYRLELLVLEYAVNNTSSMSGLSSLPSLKEVVMKGPCTEELMGNLRDQISRNSNNPVLKRE